MFFKLRSEVIPVFSSGKQRLCLVDTITQRNYDFDGEAVVALYDIIENGLSIEDCNDKFGKENTTILVKLNEMGLGDFYPKNVHVEKIRTMNPSFLKNARFRKFQLSRMGIELTGECNFSCKFCTGENHVYRSCGCKRWNDEKKMKYDDYVKLINSAQKLGLRRIDFIGGEPLLCWDILKELIIKFCSHIQMFIFTNGYLLDQEKIHFLSQSGVGLVIQYLGNCQKIYDDTMENRNIDHNVLMENLKNLKESRCNYSINLIVNLFNENYIEQIEKDTEDVKRMYIFPTNKYSSEKFHDEMMGFSARKIQVDLNTYQSREYFNNCLYGNLFVACDGNIYPCSMLREKMGNYYDDELWEIFADGRHNKFWNASKNTIETCCECEKRLICFDCRALDSYASGKLNGIKFCDKVECKNS